MKKGYLTLAGVLLFSKNPEIKKPVCIIKAVSYFGNVIEGKEYRDSMDIAGSISFQFKDALAFILRNLKRIQNGKSFNVKGELEVSQGALEELLANALIHRDYFRNAVIRILVFDNRIEIISPGSLPNNLTIENIKSGVSIIRNPVIASFANKMIPYRGLGSGILRALKEQPNIELLNDVTTEQFKVIIPRPVEK
jgi:ATP-dependent DNA helicase RecG